MFRARAAALALLACLCFRRPGGGGRRATGLDADGVTHITDTPTDPRYQRIAGGFSGSDAGWLKVPEASRSDLGLRQGDRGDG